MKNQYFRSLEIATVKDDDEVIIMVPDTGKIHELDEVSTFIWEQIPETGSTVSAEKVASKIAEIYDVDFETALSDTIGILHYLLDEKVINCIME